jgi:biopolymer transport protein ExbD
MTWKIRHEGSPQAVEGLSLEEVLHGLADGNWEPTDEVMGPNDKTWKKLEDHPQFAEIASELQGPRARTYGDEDAHVDMNALIDVCMVLLIFFILTTSYNALQSRLDSPDVAPKAEDAPQALKMVEREDAELTTIVVVIEMENGKPVITVAGKKVTPDKVEDELKSLVRGSKKTTLTLDVDPKVPVGVSLPIQRDAAAAGIKNIQRNARD